jgi:hypothetical protein
MFGQVPPLSRRNLAIRWAIGLALQLAPFAIIALTIEPPMPDGGTSLIPWYVFWIGALVPGIVGIHVLPISRRWQGGLTALYVPAGLFATAWFALALACGVFGNCP